jgi:hypothetical protein
MVAAAALVTLLSVAMVFVEVSLYRRSRPFDGRTRLEVDLSPLASVFVALTLHDARASTDPVDALIASRANEEVAMSFYHFNFFHSLTRAATTRTARPLC